MRQQHTKFTGYKSRAEARTDPSSTAKFAYLTRRNFGLEDNLLISRLWPRIVGAIDATPDGTILLTSTLRSQSDLPILQRTVGELQQRFDFQVLETSPDGLEVIRLHSHPQRTIGSR